MTRSAALRLAATLGLMTLFGASSVANADPALHFGAMWPAGLASGALLIAPRALAPYTTAAVAVLGTLTFVVGDYPLGVSVGYGLAVAAEALATQQVLTASWTRRVALRNNSDFGRFMLACGAGSVVGALLFTATSALASFGTAWRVGLAVLVTHAAAQLVLLGLFKEPTHRSGEARHGEISAAWVNSVVITTIAFIPTEMPSLAFLVIPGLGWMALRAPMREALLQLVVVSVIASTLTSAGYGPFSDPFLVQNLDPEFRLLPLQAFLIACAMVSIPFSMAVGAQQRSAAEAQVERARSERLVQSARGIAIIETDDRGLITTFNPGAERILGYSADEVLGQPTAIFHTEKEIARFSAQLGAAPDYGDFVRVMRERSGGVAQDIEYICKDGSRRVLSTILNPVRDEKGALTGYVATADDVTERLGAHQALETALATEREAVQRLTEVDLVKDRFVSSVSHELRTPITNIVGYLELLMDGVYGDPNQEQSRAMSRIETNSRRLLTLIDDLLTLSSMETLDQDRELAPVDLVAVVRRAEEIVRPGLLRRDLRLDVEVPDDAVMIPGDAGQLERLVINLATNAVKFTLDGGSVTLRLVLPVNGDGPVLEVSDTGIGIPEHEQEMLFNRFFRAAHAREAAVPGSGLGLSIAKAIAELHGAHISATSVYGSGSTFRVAFPNGARTT